jgi:cobalt-zinc-cadmium efflux system outer membrane protein
VRRSLLVLACVALPVPLAAQGILGAPAGARVAPATAARADSVARQGLGDLERAALDSNPGLRVAALDVRQARADVVTAGLRPNPTAQITGDVLPLRDGTLASAHDNTYGLSLQLPIELGGKRQRRTETALALAEGAGLGWADSARKVLLVVRGAYFDLQNADQALALAERNLAIYQRLTTLSQNRLEQKQISGAEYSRAVLGRAQAELARDAALLAVRRAQDNLALAVGRRARVAAADTLALLQREVPALAQLEQLALRQRPDVLAARALRTAATANVALQEANAQVTPTVSADFVTSQGTTSYGLSGNVPLAIFNRNQGEREKARAREEQSARALAAAEVAALTDVRAAWADWDTRRAAVARFAAGGSEGILARAQAVLDATEFAYKAGSISLLEYLDAVRTSADITRAYVDAVTAYDKAVAALDAATGADTPRLLDRIPGGRP